jgi:hypothetical protein
MRAQIRSIPEWIQKPTSNMPGFVGQLIQDGDPICSVSGKYDQRADDAWEGTISIPADIAVQFGIEYGVVRDDGRKGKIILKRSAKSGKPLRSRASSPQHIHYHFTGVKPPP